MSATCPASPDRDHFAAYNGTAPIEVSSGNRKIYRLSRRGNRRLNHAIHMAAVTQIRYRHSDGRAYYDRKLAEGKTRKEALRCPQTAHQRRHLRPPARRRPAGRRSSRQAGPGGQTGNDSVASAAGSHPETPALRPSHSRTRHQPYDALTDTHEPVQHRRRRKPGKALDNKEASFWPVLHSISHGPATVQRRVICASCSSAAACGPPGLLLPGIVIRGWSPCRPPPPAWS